MWDSPRVDSYEVLYTLIKTEFIYWLNNISLMNKRESQIVCPFYTLFDKSAMNLMKSYKKLMNW